MDTRADDFYPTRLETSMAPIDRLDPVIHSRGENRTYGPLMVIPGSHKTFIPCVGRTSEDNYRSSLKKQDLGVPSEQDIKEMANKHDIKAP